MTGEELERSLTNHPPTPQQVEAIEATRRAAKAYGHTIDRLAHASANRTIAMRKLEESVMYAVKSIVLNGTPLDTHTEGDQP